jgi:hypothetical protein
MEAIVPSVVTRRKRGAITQEFSVDRRQAGSSPTAEHHFRVACNPIGRAAIRIDVDYSYGGN